MKVFKRILVIFLCVCLLTTSISYRVKAAKIAIGAGLTAKTIFDICLFVGGTLAAGYAVGEVVDNKEDIARAGKEFIDSVKEIPEAGSLA